MASSSGKRLKTTASKRKDKEPEQPPSSRFLSHKHEKHFKIVQDRRLLMERKAGMIPNFASQFGEQLVGRNWRRLATNPAPVNIVVVKEFYTNARRLGDYPTEDYLSYVKGHAISLTSIGLVKTTKRWCFKDEENMVQSSGSTPALNEDRTNFVPETNFERFVLKNSGDSNALHEKKNKNDSPTEDSSEESSEEDSMEIF
ncbi:hypothetical protein LR48_Vigan04g131700 [Vigna angularis]|uniref:Putative plant transposon protein domain-containing protein n=1 Tax=Phaseolus angularis TaxID=3914 RepID=A0A0L9UF00_PHAAN|nr:hypothetical protein LR48_Vigan04g131700 [Vigna angularis]